ncbi:integrase catalytic subunit [Microcella alkaliphila]|uniref:Integrase catalytic subunit n=2 Tax=Microcella alkaliphila TaxID=279828 RepID=A0A0U5BK36_9MICO|nr:integrase catalytic subunit [Microcella alkaliphila]
MARWRRDGEAGLEPRSRRPKTSPNATPTSTIELITNLRANLHTQGLDHGPTTIAWHLQHHNNITVSRATIARNLKREGLVIRELVIDLERNYQPHRNAKSRTQK